MSVSCVDVSTIMRCLIMYLIVCAAQPWPSDGSSRDHQIIRVRRGPLPGLRHRGRLSDASKHYHYSMTAKLKLDGKNHPNTADWHLSGVHQVWGRHGGRGSEGGVTAGGGGDVSSLFSHQQYGGRSEWSHARNWPQPRVAFIISETFIEHSSILSIIV